MRIRSLLVVALLAASLAMVTRPASACSCATFDTRRALADAPAAFVGTLLAREPLSSSTDGSPGAAGEEGFRFQAEEVVKGPLGPVVEVRSASNEAACGLSAPAGRSVGVILREQDGRWYGSLCLQPTPERLLRAAQPLPAPDGRSPPALVLASTYGEGRAFGLDVDGRITSIGSGSGTTTAVSVCPGRARLAELFTTPTPEGGAVPGVAIREVATLAVETEHLLSELSRDPTTPAESTRLVEAVSCRDPEGKDVLLAARDGVGAEGRGRILRLADGRATIVWEGPAPRHVSFDPAGRAAYLNLYPAGEDLVRVDLRQPEEGTSQAEPIARVPAGSGPMISSPDGRRLAGVAHGTNQASRVVLVNVETSPAVVHEVELSGAGIAGEMSWADDTRVVFTPRLRPAEPVRVYDRALRELASWTGWIAERSAVTADGMLYGASQGSVRAAPAETGPATVIREIEDALVFAVVDVSAPSAPAPAPAPEEVAPTTTTTTVPVLAPPSTTTTTTLPVSATTTAPAATPPPSATTEPPGPPASHERAAPPPSPAPPTDPGSGRWIAVDIAALCAAALIVGNRWRRRRRQA